MLLKMTHRVSFVPTGLGKTSPLSAICDITHVSLDDEKSLREQYEFGEKLGEGSFGVVWRVTHCLTGQQYACKTINKDKLQGQRIMKLIDREVKILKDVSHQHIIELKQVFETTQKIYLIMELCEGGELSKLVTEHGPFTESETKVIMQQLARAISYLHKNGKVHRDLKLENILLSKKYDSVEQLCIKVTDFGLSIEKGGVGPDNMMDDYCGTPMYMAPEIIEYRSYSEKCDIWAMGVIMFKLLTGADDRRLTELTKGPGIRDKLADGYWNYLTPEVKDCLVGIMRWDPAHRLTADELLDHPWINGLQLDISKPRNVLEMMKEFRDAKDSEDHETNVQHTSVISKSSSVVKSGLVASSASTVTTNSRSNGPRTSLRSSASTSALSTLHASPSSARLLTDSAVRRSAVKAGTRASTTPPVAKIGSATKPTNGTSATTKVLRTSVTSITHGRQKSS